MSERGRQPVVSLLVLGSSPHSNGTIYLIEHELHDRGRNRYEYEYIFRHLPGDAVGFITILCHLQQ